MGSLAPAYSSVGDATDEVRQTISPGIIHWSVLTEVAYNIPTHTILLRHLSSSLDLMEESSRGVL
jgi:hypothetical protein